MTIRSEFDVVVVGAGPAGLAAACAAAESDARVALLDDNPSLGGQIWRSPQRRPGVPRAAVWFDRVDSSAIDRLTGTRVVAARDDRELVCETPLGARVFRYERLILATGARERFLPFPGWTLPGVLGAGGLQALAKSGLPIAGKSIIVAGSGPLLLAVAAFFREHGARVPLIAEQAPLAKLVRFGKTLLQHPGKAAQAMKLRRAIAGAPYQTSSWPLSVAADAGQLRVQLQYGRYRVTQVCDYLACGFGLTPNVELATLLGCDVRDGSICVDELQQTSRGSVFAAGEATGIGGVDLATTEGQIAGYAAGNAERRARRLFSRRRRARRFGEALETAFTLRDELRQLADDATIVCRCEDVRLGQLVEFTAARDAKLQTRCGMGPCQGRVCGSALEFLLGWRPSAVRPPLFPTALENLAIRDARDA